MSLEYVNRRGQCYFVLQGKTKAGKPKYYCSKRAGGVPVERLPEDFEIHENPENALVSVRKIRPTRILGFEREALTRQANELAATAVLVDVAGDSLVAYASDLDPAASIRLLTNLLGEPPAGRSVQAERLMSHAHYSPMFRFTLVDEDERLYSAQRWCYRGRIDSWISLLMRGPLPLEALGQCYFPHLGKESFFELI